MLIQNDRSMKSQKINQIRERIDLFLENVDNKKHIELTISEIKKVKSQLFSFKALYESLHKNTKLDSKNNFFNQF